MNSVKVKNLSILGLMTGVTILLASTPLGFIQVGPLAATTMHIPVIVVAILYGRKLGGLMGLIFGLISLARAYLNPTPTSFIMMDPLVSVVPRLVMGFSTGLIAERINSSLQKPELICSTLGTLLNTILVMGSLYFLHGKEYFQALNIPPTGLIALIGGMIITNVIPEVFLAGLLIPAITRQAKKSKL